MTASKTHKATIDNSKALQAPSVDECITLINQAKSTLGITSLALTKAAKARTPRPRTGSPAIITTIGRLATEQGIVVPKYSVATMMQSLQTVQTLAPLQAAITAFLKVVEDAMLAANGQAWASATAFYTVLQRVQGTDGDLEAELEPLATFFKKGIKPAGSTGKNAAPPAAPTPAGESAPVAPAATATPVAAAATSAPNSAPAGASAAHAS
jgi:hypothetical protein